ncbi:MAG TPA: RHS repeat-associated core domain-containing protein, partial [Thermoleophilaceae bacterium]
MAPIEHGRYSPRAVARRLFFALALVLATVAAALGTATGEDREEKLVGPAPGHPTTQESVRKAREDADRRARERNAPEARERRAASRTAFRDTNRAEASSLARSRFEEFFDERLWSSPKLPKGDRLAGYLDDFTGVVERPGEQDLLLSSTSPLVARDQDGEKAPIDSELVERDGALEPRNVPFGLRIAKDARGGVRLGPDVRMFPAGTRKDSEALVREDRAFFADVGDGEDTDLIVGTVPGGVSLSFQLRSADSPEDPALELDLPPGLRLRPAEEGNDVDGPVSGGAEVVDGDRVLVGFVPPMALDADGEALEAKYEVRGKRLVVKVPHREKDVRYPILVDPYTYAYEDYYEADFLQTSSSPWTYQETLPNFDGHNGWIPERGRYGVVIRMKQLQSYEETYWAQWIWQAPPYLQIVRADWLGVYHHTPDNFSCVQEFIFGNWQVQGPWYQFCDGRPSDEHASCTDPVSPCASGGASEQNASVLRFVSTRTGPRFVDSYVYMPRAIMQLWENHPPSDVSRSSSAPGQWIKPSGNHTFDVGANDLGLGLRYVSFRRPNRGSPSTVTDTRTIDCWANRHWRCPGDLNGVGLDKKRFSYNYSDLPDGRNRLGILVTDWIGNPSAGAFDNPSYSANEWDVRVDGTAPGHGSFGGSLNNRNGWITDPSPSLSVTATDSNPNGGEASGVRWNRIEFDPGTGPSETKNGEQPGNSGACDANTGCKGSLPHSLGWPGASDGTHTVRVTAEDAAANGATPQQWNVKLDRVKPTIGTPTGSLAVPDGTWIDDTTKSVTVPTSDATAGIERVELTVTKQGSSNEVLRDTERPLTCCPKSYSPTLDWTPASTDTEGTYVVKVKAYDEARPSDPTVLSWTVKLDRSDPAFGTVTGELAPNGGWVTHSNPSLTVPLSDTGSGVKRNTITIDASGPSNTLTGKKGDGTDCDARSGCPNAVNHPWTPPISDGQHTIRSAVEDAVGRTKSLPSWTVKIDRVKPTIDTPTGSLAVPDGTWITDGAKSVTAPTTDATSGIAKVELTVTKLGAGGADLVRDTKTPGTCCPGSFTPTLQWTPVAGDTEGTYVVKVKSYDEAHPTDPAERSWQVKLDRADPVYGTVGGELAPNGGWVNHPNPSVSIPLSDTGSGVKRNTIAIDSPGGPTNTLTGKKGDGSDCDAQSGCPASLTHSWTPPIGDGTHTIRADVQDGVLRPKSLGPWTVKLDRSKPTIDVTTGGASVNNAWIAPGKSYDVGVDTSDVTSGVRKIELSVDNPDDAAGPVEVDEEPGDCTASGCATNPPAKTLTWSVPSSWTPKTAVLSLVATDDAGNPSVVKTWTLRVDGVAPHQPQVSGALWDARGTATNLANLPLSVTVSDGTADTPGSGVKAVRLLVRPESPAGSSYTERGTSGDRPCADKNCGFTTGFNFLPQNGDQSRIPRDLTVEVEDHVGNKTLFPAWKVIFDRRAPVPQPPDYAERWHGELDDATAHVSGTDDISGITELGLYVPQAIGGWQYFSKDFGCPNVIPAACDESESTDITHSTVFAAEGRVTATSGARDRAGNTATADGTLKIDRSPPTFTRSGAACCHGTWLGEGPHELTINATDPYSGVKSSEVNLFSPKKVARDSFDRTRPTTWGPADFGGDWAELAGQRAAFGVDDFTGTVEIPQDQARAAHLPDTAVQDVDAKVRVRLPEKPLLPAVPPAQGRSIASLVLRRQESGEHYRANLIRNADGTWQVGVENEAGTEIVAPQSVDAAANDEVWIRATALGYPQTTIKVHAWKAGQPEPDTFASNTVAAGPRGTGSVGLRGFQDTESSQVFHFDDFVADHVGSETLRDRVERDCGVTGCPNSMTHRWDWPTAGAADGSHTFRVVVADPLGHAAQQSWAVGLDRGGPELTLSGSLKDSEGQPLVGLQRLHLDARDGHGHTYASMRSGVKTLKLWVDRNEHDPNDHPELTQEQACPQNSCGMVADYDFIAQQHTPGEHILTIETTDQVGNLTRKTLRAVVPAPADGLADRLGLENYFAYDSTETGAGTGLHVNMETGNAVWHSVPIVSPGRGLSTVVNLSYNSQARPEDMPVPYDSAGRGFSLGISGLTRVNERLDIAAGAATITLTDADGTRHRFASADGGMTFQPPPGVNLHLRRYGIAVGSVALPGHDLNKIWAITRPDGVTYFYDQRGWPTTIEDRNGNKIRYEYEYRMLTEDAPCSLPIPAEIHPLTGDVVCIKRLKKVHDPAGRYFELEYFDDLLDGVLTSRVKSIKDHDGRLHTFEYDGTYLKTFRQAVGTGEEERSFSFDYELPTDAEQGSADRLISQRKMTAVVDPRGSRTEIEYPARDEITTGSDALTGRTVKSVQDRGDRPDARTEYHFGADAECPAERRCTTVNDALGRDTRHELDLAGRVVARTDARGTEDEVRSAFAWDDENNLTEMTVALDTPDEATTRMEYAENGMLVRRVDPRGKATAIEYDNKPGNHVSPVPLTRDAEGVFVSDVDRIVNARGKAWDFDVDERGNEIRQTDPAGAVATTTYDASGQVIEEVEPRFEDDPVNKTTYSLYDPSGQPGKMVDPRGNAPGGDPAKHRWLYCYDVAGNLIRATDPRGATSDDPCAPRDRYTWKLTYDERDRVVQLVSPILSESNRFATRTFSHDDSDNPISEQDATGALTTRSYTRMDLVEDELLPEAEYVHPTSDDPAARVSARAKTHNDYDVEENLTSQVAPLGAASGPGDHQTDFQYDALDRILVQTRRSNASGEKPKLVTSFDYDLRGNVVGVADARKNDANPADPVANAEQPGTRRFTYKYDLANNRTVAIEDPGAGGLNLTTTFTYSPTGKLLFEVDPRGNIRGNLPAEGAQEDHRSEIRYDERDLVTDEIDQDGDRTHYDLRGDGRPVSMTTPRGMATKDVDDDFRADFEYYPTGELRRYEFPRDTASSVPYLKKEFSVEYLERDAVGSPTKIRDARGNQIDNTFFDTGDVKTTNRAWWWQADGDSVVERDPGTLVRPGEAQSGPDEPAAGDYGGVGSQEMPPIVPRAGAATFDYDAEMRLESVKNAKQHETKLHRNPLGLVTKTTLPFGATDAANIETQVAYDQNGNVRQTIDGLGQRTINTYDQYDRLVRVEAPGADKGRETTRYKLDANDSLLETITAEGAVWRNEYDAADRLIATESPEDRNGKEITAYSYDAAGNLTETITPRGNAIRRPDGTLNDDEGTGCDTGGQTADVDCFKTTRRYTPGNQVEEEVDGHGHVTRRTYDPNGNVTKVVAPGSASSSDGDELTRVTHRAYDGRDLPWRTLTGGNEAGEGGDTALRRTFTEFDGNGNVRRQVTPAGISEDKTRPRYADTDVQRTSGASAKPEHRSDASVKNAAYNAHVREYDPDNVLESILLPWGDSDAGADGLNKDDKRRYRQDFKLDERGLTTEISGTYEWVKGDANEEGKPNPKEKTTYSYYDSGWVRQSVEATGEARQTSDYTYDQQGNQRTWELTAGNGSNPAKRRVVRHHYDNGLLRERTANASGDGTKPGSRRYSYEYDKEGRAALVTDPDLHRRTRIHYDLTGRETLVDEEATNGTEPNWAKDTLTRYDLDGNVASRYTEGRATDGDKPGAYALGDKGKKTVYEHDSLGRETSTHVDRGGHDRYFMSSYYSSGQRKERKRYDGSVGSAGLRTTEKYFFERDGRLNRRERKSHGENGNETKQSSFNEYKYDTNGNRTLDRRSVDNADKDDTEDRHTYRYNARDQVMVWEREKKRNGNTTLSARVEYTLDGTGQLKTKEERQGGRRQVTNFGFHEDGSRQIKSETVTEFEGDTENKVGEASTHFCRSPFGETTSQRLNDDCGPGTGGEDDTKELGVTDFDAFGRVTRAVVRQRGERTAKTESYGYDGFDRRDFKCQAGAVADDDDPCEGHRRIELSYIGTSPRLSAENDKPGAGAGETETEKDRSYDYSSNLEPLGFRSKEREGDGDEYRSYVTGPTGTVEGLAGKGGEVDEKETYQYDPYGKAMRRDLDMGPVPTNEGQAGDPAEDELDPAARENPFRFQGQYYDSGVKTYDMHARQYAPDVGRFQSADRFEDASADMNIVSDPLTQDRYAFAGGNPINMIDWDGHEPSDSFTDGCDMMYGSPWRCRKEAREGARGRARYRRTQRLRRQNRYAQHFSRNWPEGRARIRHYEQHRAIDPNSVNNTTNTPRRGSEDDGGALQDAKNWVKGAAEDVKDWAWNPERDGALIQGMQCSLGMEDKCDYEGDYEDVFSRGKIYGKILDWRSGGRRPRPVGPRRPPG